MIESFLIFKVFLILVTLALFTNCNETIRNDFNNIEDIKELSYIEKGWVPDIIPNDCFDIRVVNNLDNDHFFGIFHFKSKINFEPDKFYQLSQKQIIKILSKIKFPSPEWFIKTETIKSNKMLFYKYKNFYLIINKLNKLFTTLVKYV